MLNRRGFFSLAAGASMTLGAKASHAGTAQLTTISDAPLRGAIDARSAGLIPGAFDDQSRALNRLIEEADRLDMAIALPAGIYVVSNIILKPRTRIIGDGGGSRLVYGGDGHLLYGENAEQVMLRGLIIDGANRRLGDHVNGLLHLREVANLALDDCDIVGSAGHGISLERCAGSIERTRIAGAAQAGIYSIEGKGLDIHRNTVSECGNGGILIHRWSVASDPTSITGNRIERIHAYAGGTGQNGNGINTFRASDVMIANNRITDCAFSAIRCNSGSNLQITGNQCKNSGETAIYAEFAFDGATITGNLIDGATNGISAVNFNEGGRLAAVQGNIIRNLRLTGPYDPGALVFGIGISVEADAAVTGNVIENAPRFGINAGWGKYLRDVAITGNVVRSCASGIAVSVSEDAGPAIVSGNLVSGAKNGAIVGQDAGTVTISDLGRSAGRGSFSRLTIERNTVS